MKKIATLIIILVMAVVAVAQNTAVNEDCDVGLPDPSELTDDFRKSYEEVLDILLKDWKKIGASGHDPALTFKAIDKHRIVVAADYNLNDSTIARLENQSEWASVVTLIDATKRLSDIFSITALLGYDVELHTTLRAGGATNISVYDYATLRHIMALDNAISESIYADVIVGQKRAPFEFEDSIFCTGMSYCNHLWTITLHSTTVFGPDDDPYLAWAHHCSEIVSNAEFMHYIGKDSTTARFVIVQDGARDTFIFEYTPAQLLGEEPAIDVDLMGTYLSKVINKTFPQPLANNVGTMESCSYDPALHVLVVDCLVDELTVLSNEGKENMLKEPVLNALLSEPDGRDLVEALSEMGLGLEYRMQSRTTRRPLTITITPDEIRVHLLEHQ